MATANDSQGLKIAVGVFVLLTVILAVSTYFAYSAYDKAEAKLVATEGKLRTATSATDLAQSQVESLQKETVGAKALDIDAFKTELKGEYKKVDDELNALIEQVNAAVSKAQESGASGPELEDAKAKVTAIAAAYRSEPNKTLLAALSRSVDLLKNLALLNNQLALTYVDVKRSLEGANGVNAQKLAVTEKALDESKTDLTGEHDKHEQERSSLITKVDQYQTENASQAAKINVLTAQVRQMEDDYTKKMNDKVQMIRVLRTQLERGENILDQPDGVVTYVDYNAGEIHTNLTFGKGARPQMQLSIFDQKSPGLPTDKPKGSVELLKVDEKGSIARIIKTSSSIDPIKRGDVLYSAAWSPNEPNRFALIGPMDINRDGKDDRADLKRLIEGAGGIVDYDLPPPNVSKPSGKISGLESWYVIDERTPFHTVAVDNSGVTAAEYDAFVKEQTNAVRELAADGVRPLRIERLLTTLGYDFRDPIVGRVEVKNNKAMRNLLDPRQGGQKAAPVVSPDPVPDAATAPVPEDK